MEHIPLLPNLACCLVTSLIITDSELDKHYCLDCKVSLAHFPGFQHLTKEGIAADVVKTSTMEEGSDNAVDKPQESMIMIFHSLTRDGNDAVLN
jgi:hypothetical protein